MQPPVLIWLFILMLLVTVAGVLVAPVLVTVPVLAASLGLATQHGPPDLLLFPNKNEHISIFSEYISYKQN